MYIYLYFSFFKKMWDPLNFALTLSGGLTGGPAVGTLFVIPLLSEVNAHIIKQ